MKRLAVDLVIINERASSYMQDLQIAIETAVRSSQSRPRGRRRARAGRGLRAARRPDERRRPARCSPRLARVVLVAHTRAPSPISSPVCRTRATAPRHPRPAMPRSAAQPAATGRMLEFFNGLGGFDEDGREYVTVLDAGAGDARALDQRDRQSRLRLPGVGRRQRLHLGR